MEVACFTDDVSIQNSPLLLGNTDSSTFDAASNLRIKVFSVGT